MGEDQDLFVPEEVPPINTSILVRGLNSAPCYRFTLPLVLYSSTHAIWPLFCIAIPQKVSSHFALPDSCKTCTDVTSVWVKLSGYA
jgi:hypothetical protein